MSRKQLEGLVTFRSRGYCDLRVLSAGARRHLVALFNQVKQAPNLVEHDDSSLGEHVDEMMSAVFEGANSKRFHLASQQFSEKQKESYLLAWGKKYAKKLSGSEYWVQQFGSVRGKQQRAEIDGIKKHWIDIEIFAECSVSILLYLANRVLPDIEGYIKTARLELMFRRERMSPRDRHRFKEYLDKLELSMAHIKTALIDTMLAKLQVCSDTEVIADYSLVYVKTKRLYEIADMSERLPKDVNKPQLLNAQEFFALHRYVEKEGQKNHHRCLKQLKWLRDTNGFVRCVSRGRYLVVPPGVDRYVPSDTWWNALFNNFDPERDFVWKKFSDKTLLIARLKVLETRRVTFASADLSGHQDYLDLNDLSKQLELEVESSHRQRSRGLFKFLFKRRNHVLDAWQESIIQSQQHIIRCKIDLLTRAYENYKTRLISDDESEAASYKATTQEFLIDIGNAVKRFGVSGLDEVRFNRIKQQFESGLDISNVGLDTHIESRLAEIVGAKGHLKGDGHLATVYHYFRGVACFDEEKCARFKRRCQPATRLVLANVKETFVTLIRQLGMESAVFVIENEAENLNRALCFVRTFGMECEQEELQKLLTALKIAYLQAGSQEFAHTLHADSFALVETLLVKFGDSALQQCAALMRQARASEPESDNDQVFKRYCSGQYDEIIKSQQQARIAGQMSQLRLQLAELLHKKVGYNGFQSEPLLILFDEMSAADRRSIGFDEMTAEVRGLLNPCSKGYSLQPLFNAYLDAAATIKSSNQLGCARVLESLGALESDLRPNIFSFNVSSLFSRFTQRPSVAVNNSRHQKEGKERFCQQELRIN